MNLKEIIKECWETAEEKGWHDKERSPLECIALIMSELGEAVEAFREGSVLDVCQDGEGGFISAPKGAITELADVVIRVFDMCEEFNYDIESVLKLKMTYNKTRGYRHGGKIH